jgi:hypothetical protein
MACSLSSVPPAIIRCWQGGSTAGPFHQQTSRPSPLELIKRAVIACRHKLDEVIGRHVDLEIGIAPADRLRRDIALQVGYVIPMGKLLSKLSTTDRSVDHPHMAMPTHGSPAANPTAPTRAVSTMRVLNKVQRRLRLNHTVCSLAERHRVADVCDKGECDHSAKDRQLIQSHHSRILV